MARAINEDAGPVADGNAEGPVARGGDAARSLADDSAEEPVAPERCEACGPCFLCRAPVIHVSSLLPGTKDVVIHACVSFHSLAWNVVCGFAVLAFWGLRRGVFWLRWGLPFGPPAAALCSEGAPEHRIFSLHRLPLRHWYVCSVWACSRCWHVERLVLQGFNGTEAACSGQESFLLRLAERAPVVIPHAEVLRRYFSDIEGHFTLPLGVSVGIPDPGEVDAFDHVLHQDLNNGLARWRRRKEMTTHGFVSCGFPITAEAPPDTWRRPPQVCRACGRVGVL